jgi:probable rRNA maturation factor
VKENLIKRLLKIILKDLAFRGEVAKNLKLNKIFTISRFSVSIFFCTNKKIKTLNSQYRSKDYPTDVLSFSFIEGEWVPISGKDIFLGDIIISLDKVLEQSSLYGISPSHELARLVIHGCLHLAGYDHENVTRYEANLMRATEKAIYGKFWELSDHNSFLNRL